MTPGHADPGAGPSLAIVIPTLGEGDALQQALARLQHLRALGVRVCVVDGAAPGDARRVGEAQLATQCDQVVHAPRGRASQMNAGASAERGADVLLFLHVDTRLPGDGVAALDAIRSALTSGARWGRFDVRLRAEGVVPVGLRMGLALVGTLMNLRSRWTGIATGDQAIWVRRADFERLGGFAPLPLMEDIDWSRRARAGLGAPACLTLQVEPSARRWQQRGWWSTVVQMWRLRWAWWRGADPQALAQAYGYRPRARAATAVLAKAPVAGLAKTRLIPLLGPRGAARAQRTMTLRTLATLGHASLGPVLLWGAPDTGAPLFRALSRRWNVPLRSQPGGDIGQRMAAAMQAHFAGPDARLPLLIVGTDCPVLAPDHLQAAADALERHTVVLIPAEDGGYVLVGMRSPVPALFAGITWSTPAVMAQTRTALHRAGVNFAELPPLWDVDEPADWRRWQQLRNAI